MVVKRLYIKNFRCFGNSPIVIDFAETGLGAFVGSNNAGKSTALKALEILLGDKWPTGQFTEDDFFKKDHTQEIVIACEFEQLIMVPWNNQEIEVVGLIVKVSYLEAGYGQSATDVDFKLLQEINNFENGDWDLACYPGGNRPVFISQEIRNSLPVAITVPLIKLQSEQPTNKWGVLGRMLQKIENAFSRSAERKNRFESQIGEAVGILREPEEFIDLERDIMEFWNEIRPKNLSGTALEFLDYDPWHYYRQFRLAITKNEEDVPLDSLGEGVQRLAVIALYRAYLGSHSRSQKAILLIEEPESYLHPQARNVVYNTLRKAIDGEAAEGQIIYTTHSADFIDCSFFEEIAIFSEAGNGSLVRQVNREAMMHHTEELLGIEQRGQADPGVYYRLTEVESIGLKDALFGGRAVIVEGATDMEYLKAFGKTNEEQISVVVCRGKDNISPVYAFLTAFGIPTLLCIDRDNPSGNATNQEIASLVNHRFINNLTEGVQDVDFRNIDALRNGTQETFRNLHVFSRDIEEFLAAAIPDYESLATSLRSQLNIGASKPKLMFAIGLCYRGGISTVTLTEPQREALQRAVEVLNRFLSQTLPSPQVAIREE